MFLLAKNGIIRYKQCTRPHECRNVKSTSHGALGRILGALCATPRHNQGEAVRNITPRPKSTRSPRSKPSALGVFIALQFAVVIAIAQMKLTSNHGNCENCGSGLIECSGCHGGRDRAGTCSNCGGAAIICPTHKGNTTARRSVF
jgi:hypothetical protein